MTTDFRAELQALVSAYDEHGGSWSPHHEDAWFAAVKRARAALAEPEPEGPTPQPIPLRERLPGPGDCDEEGRCWIHMPDIATAPSWRLVDPREIGLYHTHWLPANALPLPTIESD